MEKKCRSEKISRRISFAALEILDAGVNFSNTRTSIRNVFISGDYQFILLLIGAKRKIYVTSLQNERIYQNRYIYDHS